MTPKRIGGVVLIVLGLMLVGLAGGLIALAYNLSRDGFAAWPDPAYIPAAGGIVGIALVVAGVLMLRARAA
jgi:hypothetical protein